MAYLPSLLERGTGDEDDESSQLARLNKAAAGLLLCKSMAGTAHSWYKKFKSASTYRVSVYGDDPIYEDLHALVLQNTPPRKQRALVGRSYRIDSYGNNDWDMSESAISAGVRFTYSGAASQKLRINGYDVSVVVSKPDLTGDPERWGRLAKSAEQIIFSASSPGGRDAVKTMLDDIAKKRATNVRVPHVYLLDKWGQWNSNQEVPLRTLNSVVLRDGQAEALVDDVATFLASEQKYVQRCVPWHRGYLFHGVPGTGKSSVACALANHFKLDLWYMPLGDLEKDQDLLRLVSRVSPRSMLLLEDIDVFHAARSREEGYGFATLSGLLNSLDGIATPHGLITVMTTNDKSVLDPALVRPGRIDRVEEMLPLDSKQAARLLEMFYPGADLERLAGYENAIAAMNGQPPSSVLEQCKRYLDSPQSAIDALAHKG